MMTSADDVVARLGRPLTDTETARLDGLTAEATALVNGWLHHTPDTTDEIRIVVSRIVARALAANTDPGVLNTGATMGPFAVTQAYTPDATNGGVWLTRPCDCLPHGELGADPRTHPVAPRSRSQPPLRA